MTRIFHPVRLPYSNLELQTRYDHDPRGERLDGDLGQHRFILGRFYGFMDQGVAAIQKEIVNEELEAELALSGIREYVASLNPKQGGTGYDRKYEWHYLTPQAGSDYNKRWPFFPAAARGDYGPYHTVLDQRISTFDFAPLVAHVMTNTPLQNVVHMPVDPRLQLVESTQNQLFNRFAINKIS